MKDGVPAAARDSGLEEPAQMYAWRSRAQQQGQYDEVQRLQQLEPARPKRELARLEEEVAFVKKGGGVLRAAAEVKYATMRAHENEFRVRLMCRALSASPTGYYVWSQRKLSNVRVALDARERSRRNIAVFHALTRP